MATLSVNESTGDFNSVVKLTFSDLITIGNGGTKQIGVIPAGGALDLCGVINSVDIAGSSSLVIDVGTTLADPDEFIDALDVDGMTVMLPTFNTGDALVQSAGNTTIKGGSLPIKAVSTDTPIYIKVTDSSVASLTAGEIVIGFRIIDLGRFV